MDGKLRKIDRYKEDKENPICNFCYTKVKYFGNTTNMRAHMSRHHPEIRIKNYKKVKNSKPSSEPTNFVLMH